MKTTYLIENTYTGDVYGYYHTLYDAKDALEKIVASRPIEQNAGLLCILQLKGQRYGEGAHTFRCFINNKNKFEHIRY